MVRRQTHGHADNTCECDCERDPACDIMRCQGKPWAVEQPHPQEGVSMFDLQGFKCLVDTGAERVLFDQCMYGQKTTNPTWILFSGLDMHDLRVRCVHEGGHPKLAGKRNQDGSYKTGATAAYPAKLNAALARIFARAIAKTQQ